MSNKNGNKKYAGGKDDRKPNSRGRKPGSGKRNDVGDNISTMPGGCISNAKEVSKGIVYNDPAWRIYNDLLGNQVASFPLTTFVGGKPVNLRFSNGAGLAAPAGSTYGNHTIATVLINPSVGYGNSTFDAINQAALKMYTEFSSSNMKTTQYGPQDIIACILALGEVISMASYIRRAVGFAGTTNPRNWLYPKRIVEAMGLDWDDLQKNVGIYREQFNYLSAIASAIAFPANLDYFNSCAALYNDVFLDHTTGMAQAYICVPASTWILNEAASVEGSALDTYEMPYLHYTESTTTGLINGYYISPTTKMSSILETFKSQLDALMNSATLQYLYADVLKFVNNNRGSLVTLPLIQDGYSVIPIYSEEFLINIENCDVMGMPSSNKWEDKAGIRGAFSSKSNNVYLKAGTNTLQYAPAFLHPPIVSAGLMSKIMYSNNYVQKVFNFHKDEPTTMDRIMAARFKSALLFSEVANSIVTDGTGITSANTAVFMLPDHYIVNIIYYAENELSSGDMSGVRKSFLDTVFRDRSLEVYAHPPITVTSSATESQGVMTIPDSTICGELDTYTVVDHDTMRKINDLAILSLFTFTK